MITNFCPAKAHLSRELPRVVRRRWPPSARFVVVTALCLASGIAAGQEPDPAPSVNIETLEGSRIGAFRGVVLAPKPQLQLEGEALDLREVLRVEFAEPVPFRRELKVTLADGSVLFGGLGPGTDDSHLAFNGRMFPEGVDIPLEWVKSIDCLTVVARGDKPSRLTRTRTPQGTVAEDRLATREGAQLTGLLLGISSEVVRFQDHKLDKLELPWANVSSISIASLEPPPTLPKDQVAISVDGLGGSYVHGLLRKLDATALEFESVLIGTVRLPMAALAAVEFRMGRVEYLSDRSPIRVVELGPAGLGFHWPWQRDANVHDGGPLRIGNRTFRRGLGVHSESHLTFAIEPGDLRFQAWIGVDVTGRPANNDPELGSVVFVVKVDGKEAYRSGDVNWERPAQKIEVDLEGGKELELSVECGKKYFILDRADWGDARILKQ